MSLLKKKHSVNNMGHLDMCAKLDPDTVSTNIWLFAQFLISVNQKSSNNKLHVMPGNTYSIDFKKNVYKMMIGKMFADAAFPPL